MCPGLSSGHMGCHFLVVVVGYICCHKCQFCLQNVNAAQTVNNCSLPGLASRGWCCRLHHLPAAAPAMLQQRSTSASRPFTLPLPELTSTCSSASAAMARSRSR